MLVLIVLVAAWLVFRAIGAAGVHVLASWQHSALYALAVMFVFTATAHFNKMKHDLAQMIPSSFPRKHFCWLKAFGALREGPQRKAAVFRDA